MLSIKDSVLAKAQTTTTKKIIDRNLTEDKLFFFFNQIAKELAREDKRFHIFSLKPEQNTTRRETQALWFYTTEIFTRHGIFQA